MFQNIGSENLIVRKYDHIRQPDPIFHVAKLNDERIVSANVSEKNNTITVTMPDLSKQGFFDLEKMDKHYDPLKLINWSIQLFEDLLEQKVKNGFLGIVAVDIHDRNIMSDGNSLVLVDYEQFWPWDRNRELFGRWRLDQAIKKWSNM